VKVLVRLYRLVRNNLAWKLAALFASTALWVAVNGSEPNADRYIRLAVSPFGLSKRLVISNHFNTSVEVQLRGPGSILRTIDATRHHVGLDLRGVQPGEVSRKIKPWMLNFPRRIRVVQINPPRIDLTIERLLTKSVPVKATLVPEHRNGYTISDVALTPATTEVSGPAGQVERLQVVETEPVNTLTADGDVEREVPLVGAVDGIAFSPDSIRVSFSVQEIEGLRTFSGVHVVVLGAGAPTSLSPSSVEVTIRGPQQRLAALKLGAGTVYVDAAGLVTGQHLVSPRVAVPTGFHLDGVTPRVVQLTVQEADDEDEGLVPSVEGDEAVEATPE
jgi:YbbR domain-containing protein